jgi:cellulose synthase/poly-beta-1,6-N-acetylglucosamine synthase-like glycosyltransferase
MNTVRFIILKVSDIWRSALAIFGRNPGFSGEKILWRFLITRFKSGDVVQLKNNGIQHDDNFYPLDLPILKFVYNNSMSVAIDDIVSTWKNLRKIIERDRPDVDKEYFQAYALYLFTTYGSIISNFFVISKIIRLWEINSISAGILSAAWLIPNTYFVIQLFLYHLSKLKTIQLTHSFTEATQSEIEALYCKADIPKVVSVIPSYMEDDKLIRHALYCHCLQRYPERAVVLLVGNDYYTDNEKALKNTRDTLILVDQIRNEFAENHNAFMQQVESLNLYRTKNDYHALSNGLANLYQQIIAWLERKLFVLQTDSPGYPTDNFLFDYTFKEQIAYYQKQLVDIQNIDGKENLIDFHIYQCKCFFKVELTSFQRYKYLNVEHERTKAGNLTAYLSQLDKRWHEQQTSDGRYILTTDEGSPESRSTYLGIFDTDTIAKPDYIIRKVAYMERSENAQVGLIQSPYNVPAPEPTIAACASGIHSQWFLPISIGMTSFKSAFWLGFNGLFRTKAVTSFHGSFIAETLIEDLENSLKIIKEGYSITTSHEYQCQTFSPPDMQGMRVQRERWASGGFRIGLIFIKDSLKGRFGKATIFEWFLRLNYIMGLNILPVVLTVTVLLECPYYHAFFGVETLPFFFYILTYAACLRNSSFTLKHYFDGLAVGLFMNFHYLKGTWTSLKVLLEKKSTQVFKATPRVKSKSAEALTTFEIFAIFFIIPLLLYRLDMSYERGHYWDVYPLYTLFTIFYGLWRFVGWRGFIDNLKNILGSNRF